MFEFCDEYLDRGANDEKGKRRRANISATLGERLVLVGSMRGYGCHMICNILFYFMCIISPYADILYLISM